MHHHSALGWLTPWDVHHGHAKRRRGERKLVQHQAFAATPERFVRGVPTPPALPAAVWINKPRTLAEPDHITVVAEPGERVARPTEWRSALAGRTRGGETASPAVPNAEELELVVAH